MKSQKSQFPPERAHVQELEKYGVELHPETMYLVEDHDALARSFGGNGIRAIFSSRLVVLCAMTACVGGLLFGFDQGLVSITLVMPRFLHAFPETDIAVTSSAGFNKGIMTAMLELGAFLGALQAGFVADKFSRKASIAVGVSWFMVGSTIQASSFHFAQLVVGRTLGGVGIGYLSSSAPMYISEIAPPNIRGSLLVLEQFMIVFGIVVMFYITYATRVINSDWCFRLPFILQMVPGVFLACVLYFLPFSPRWLAGKGRDQECLDSLVRLRKLPSSDPRVQAEWITIRTEALHNREALLSRHPKNSGTGIANELRLEMASWVDMFRPAVIKRTHIGIGLMFFQQFVGINALIYYSPTLFQTLGLSYDLQLTMSGVMNVIQLVATIPPLLYLDKLGRKPMLLVGSVGMSISHFIVAAMIGKYSYDWLNHAQQAWVGVAFIFIYIAFYGVGWGPIPWAMPAEVHASSYRAKGVALATCSNWFNNFIIGLVTPPLIQHTGYGTFIFFGVFSVLSGVWTWFFVAETKGKTLEQIDKIFHSKTAIEDEAQKREILRLIVGSDGPSASVPALHNGASHDRSSPTSGKEDSKINEQWIEKV